MAGFVLRNPSSTRTTGKSLLVAGQSFNFITQSMKKKFLDSFERDLDSKPLYLFYGQSRQWNSSPGGVGIDSPVIPDNAFKHNINARANMIAGQRIRAGDTRPAFRKVVWKPGTVYNQYDTEVDQSVSPNNNYYIIQDNQSIPASYGAVYKCLDNNNGSVSINKPFNFIKPETVEPRILPDGYKWKYMFTISGAELSRFNTDQSPLDDFVPMVVDTTYKSSRGTIDRIDVDSPGISYKPALSGGKYLNVYDTPVVPFYIDGDGDYVNSAQVFVENINETTGAITTLRGVGLGAASISYGGRQDRYTVLGDTKLNRFIPIKLLEELSDLDGSTIDAISKADRKFAYGVAQVDDNGLISSPGAIKIISGGTNYVEGQKVRVVQSSTIAFGTQYNSNDGITKLTVLQAGTNHTSASAIPIHSSPGPKGFIGRPILSPLLGHGGDPKLELNSRAIFVNARINSTDQSGNVSVDLDFPAVNDFRQVGLIQAPLKAAPLSPNDLVVDTTARATHVMVVNDTADQLKTQKESAIANDLLLTGSVTRAQGRVIDIFGDDVLKTIRYVQVGKESFRANEQLLFKNISQAITIDDVKGPEMDVYSGDILFINNNNKILRGKNQTETVNFLIQF